MESYQSTSSMQSTAVEADSQPDLEQGDGATDVLSGRRQTLLMMSKLRSQRNLYSQHDLYDWTEFAPAPKQHPLKFIKWLVEGVSSKRESDEALQHNLSGVARLLVLLREYQDRFGMPEVGRDRKSVV